MCLYFIFGRQSKSINQKTATTATTTNNPSLTLLTHAVLSGAALYDSVLSLKVMADDGSMLG
jgi:hypothetical protein